MKISIALLIIILFFAIIAFYNINSKSTTKKINKPASPSVTINSAKFKTTLARTTEEKEKGLGYRTSLPRNEGMLFLFDKPSYNPFWMHGMKFPLDIIFILDNKIVAIYENLPPIADDTQNPPLYGTRTLSDMVFEINAGLAKKYNIKIGDSVKINLIH